MQMVVRSPFLLGLSRQTLTARMQALHVAMPHANVQSMAQYYPSLLEVLNPARICCITLSIIMYVDVRCMSCPEALSANSHLLNHLHFTV